MNGFPTTEVEFPASHVGRFTGRNRLWLDDPATPFESEGALEVEPRAVRYRWAHEGASHEGTIALRGQPDALEARWHDTFHAKDGFVFHGFAEGGLLRLYGIFEAGGTAWGWRIELEWREAASFTMRMFLVVPERGSVPAVLLEGARDAATGADRTRD
jgi:hypothetical protein